MVCRILNWHHLSTENEIKIYEPLEEKADLIIEKNIYSVVNPKLLDFIKAKDIQKVYVCGIDTDCCVLKTAVDLFENNIRSIVLEGYSASNGGEESHKAAIKVLNRMIGKDSIIYGRVEGRLD